MTIYCYELNKKIHLICGQRRCTVEDFTHSFVELYERRLIVRTTILPMPQDKAKVTGLSLTEVEESHFTLWKMELSIRAKEFVNDLFGGSSCLPMSR